MAKVNIFGGPTIPQPLVQELPQDDAWDEWQKAVQTHEAKFAPTAPAPLYEARQPEAPPPVIDMLAELPAAPVAAPPATRKETRYTLDHVLHLTREGGRICPRPDAWTKLYVLLAQHRTGTARLPPPPLVGPAWDKTPVLAKRMSFHAHVEWAEPNGCLPAVAEFLAALPEEQWYCGR